MRFCENRTSSPERNGKRDTILGSPDFMKSSGPNQIFDEVLLYNGSMLE
jgi:hypothetical protein